MPPLRSTKSQQLADRLLQVISEQLGGNNYAECMAALNLALMRINAEQRQLAGLVSIIEMAQNNLVEKGSFFSKGERP